MDTRKKMECLKRVYPKDYILCNNFLNKCDYTGVSEILHSIRHMEVKERKLNEEEEHHLISLSSYIDDMVRIVDQEWLYASMEEPPDDLFLNDTDQNDE